MTAPLEPGDVWVLAVWPDESGAMPLEGDGILDAHADLAEKLAPHGWAVGALNLEDHWHRYSTITKNGRTVNVTVEKRRVVEVRKRGECCR